MADTTNTTAAPAATLGPLNDRAVKDAIRGAYELGYNDGKRQEEWAAYEVEQDHGGALIHTLSRRLAAPAAQEAEPATGRWVNADDVDRLVREIDIALYGSGAAEQAKLCDLAGLVTHAAAKAGRPLLQADAGASMTHAEAAAALGINSAIHRIEHGDAQGALEPLREAARVLSAAARAGAVPEGWRLVPVEPTPEMVTAIPWPTNVTPTLGLDCYRAMLAAAPQAPAEAVVPAAAPTQEADGWMPIETAPDGERVLLGPRHAPVVGMVHRPAFWEEEQEPTATVVHYNGNVLVAGYRCSEWHRLPGSAPAQEAEDAVVMSYAIDCEITVERVRQASGADRWAVRRDGRVLNKQGEWEWEPMPSSRDEEFLARCRFDSAREAIDAARARQEGGGA